MKWLIEKAVTEAGCLPLALLGFSLGMALLYVAYEIAKLMVFCP